MEIALAKSNERPLRLPTQEGYPISFPFSNTYNKNMRHRLAALTCILSLCLGLSGCGTRLPEHKSNASAQALILSPTENRMYVFNTLVNRVEHSLPVGQTPVDLTLAPGGAILVANQVSNSLSVFQRVDGLNYARVGTVGTMAAPSQIAVNSIHREAYVTFQKEPLLQVLALRTPYRLPEPTQVVRLSANTVPSAVVVSPDGNTVYVADQQQAVLLKITRQDQNFTVGQNIPLETSAHISQMVFHNHKLYLADQALDKVHILDIGQNKIEQSIALKSDTTGERPIMPRSMALNHTGTKLYVTGNGTSTVHVIGLAASKQLQTLNLQGDDVKFDSFGPIGIDITHDDRRVYISSQSGRNVVMLETNPDASQSERLLRTLGTSASEGALKPLGVLRLVQFISTAPSN